MVNFVKPNLLGTRKEFTNRFISPIQNGQCTDSTLRDVKIMKARAHVLHEMLAGCVQVQMGNGKILSVFSVVIIAVTILPLAEIIMAMGSRSDCASYTFFWYKLVPKCLFSFEHVFNL